MLTWIIIILVLLAIVIFVKTSNKGQNFWSYIIVVAAIFFVITLVYVVTLPGINLTTLDGVLELGKLYFAWIGKILINLTHITGSAIKLDWGANFTGR